MSDITLSFDNGPEPGVTPFVLDALARHGIKATFFVIGRKLVAAEGRALAERAHDEGHWIGNHTYTHSVPLGRMAPEAAIAEIRQTDALIGSLRHPNRLFRPYGEGGILDQRILSKPVVDYLCETSASCVTWNAVPRDWADQDGWVDTALRQTDGEDDSLVVLHDLPVGALSGLETFIDRALARGSAFHQDIPESCKLIWDGRVMRDLTDLVT